jgi:hypothetical protein
MRFMLVALGAAAAPPHEYQLPGGDVARIFELRYAETPQQLQERRAVVLHAAATAEKVIEKMKAK